MYGNARLALQAASFPYWLKMTSVDVTIWGPVLIGGSDTGYPFVELVLSLLFYDWLILSSRLVC